MGSSGKKLNEVILNHNISSNMLNFNYRRGLIFGIWASTQSVGNIAGALMVASVVNYGYQVSEFYIIC